MAHDPAPEAENPAPETLEGWYVLHDGYRLDWARWRAAEPKLRAHAVEELLAWNGRQQHVDQHAGDSALYTIVGQKADLVWVHYRRTPTELAQVERSLRACAASDFLQPAYTYLSVIEASLYEATAIAHGMLARRGLTPGKPAFEDALAEELERQREHLTQRVFRRIPEQTHICIYPMNKRRGEHVNWYDMPLDERRALMRSHGKLGRKYVDRVTQVVSGSVGLDAWEWMVDLHADDPLQFKKLIYEMRFDPASARFAEFGDFLVGIKRDGDGLRSYLTI